MITVRLFGGASLEDGGGVLMGPATHRHRLALLALLAVTHPRGLARDRLASWLWPGRDSAHARNLLRQAVHALRRALGDDAIISAGDELRFAGDPAMCDVTAFAMAVAENDARRAAELYAGPLLDGFTLPDAPDFEQWVDAERERLRRDYCRTLESLAHDALARGTAEEAARWWRARAALEPESARVTLELMRALAAAGDRAGAIRQARVHAVLVKEEFDAEPDAGVQDLAEQLRTGTDAIATSRRDEPRSEGDVPSQPEPIPTPHIEAPGPARPRISAARLRPRRRATAALAAVPALLLAAWLSVNAFSTRDSTVRRIAVLPLANLMGDPQQDHVVAGMHDALISALAQIDALTVLSRQSVLRYAGSDMPLPDIARELGVDALVEGSVFRAGDSIRVTVQLVRARPEGHLWTASHYGPVSSALALQGEVARGIAGAVHARLEPDVRARLMRARDVRPDAQRAFLEGLHHFERAGYGPTVPPPGRSAELVAAIGLFEQAVALDSTWAAAWARLAQAYHWMAGSFHADPAAQRRHENEYFPRSKAAALRALALDPAESHAWAALGFVLFAYEWDWTGAERAFGRALELDPNSHHWAYALFLQAAGRHDEAIRHLHLAEERHPLSDVLKHRIVNAYACAEQYDEAIAQARALNARVASSGLAGVNGDSLWLLDFTSRQLALQGKHDAALDMASTLAAMSDYQRVGGPALAFVLGRAGRRDEARVILDRLEEAVVASGGTYRPAHHYALVGDHERALDMVEAALGDRRARKTDFRCTVTYGLLRDEPRMQALLSPVGFPR